MWSVPASVQSALLGSGVSVDYDVDVITPTGTTSVTLNADSSGVQYSAQSKLTRVATLNVPTRVIDLGLLNPLRDHVFVKAIIDYVTIPLGYFRPLDMSEHGGGSVSVRCVDNTDDVLGNQFSTPWYSVGGDALSELRRLVQNTDPTFVVNAQGSLLTTRVPALAWDTDAGRAMDDIAAGVAAVWLTDRVGGFIITPSPYSLPTPPDPVLVLRDGVSGVIIDVEKTTSRAGVWNSVTVVVERTDGSAPLTVIARDNDPLSDTYYGGSFGRRNRTYRIQTPIDNVAAGRLATQLLRQVIGVTETWTITLPFMPLLDPHDLVAVNYRNVVSPVVVETIELSLDAKSSTRITGRRLQLADPATVEIIGG